MKSLNKIIIVCFVAIVLFPAVGHAQFMLLSPPSGAEIDSAPKLAWSQGEYDEYIVVTFFYYSAWKTHIDISFPFSDSYVSIPSGWWEMLGTESPHIWAVVGVDRATLNWGIAEPGGFFFLKQKASSCTDLDEDGYGKPADPSCDHPEPDCVDDPSNDPEICDSCTCGQESSCAPCARCINSAVSEAAFGDYVCKDGLDNNCDELVDAEDPGCYYPGGEFNFQIVSITQQEPGCFIGPLLMNLIESGLQGIDLPVELPAYTASTFLFELQIPVLGQFQLQAEFGDNLLSFSTVGQEFDIGKLGIPLGFNCLIRGDAAGEINPLDQSPLSTTIHLSNLTVEEGSGVGNCTALNNNPDPECTMEFVLEEF